MYLFNYNSVAPLFNKTDPEVAIMNQMTDYWTSFARDGKPYSNITNIEWKPSNKAVLQTLYINNSTTLSDGPYQDRFKFWDDLFPVNGSNSLKVSIITTLCVLFMNIRFLF